MLETIVCHSTEVTVTHARGEHIWRERVHERPVVIPPDLSFQLNAKAKSGRPGIE